MKTGKIDSKMDVLDKNRDVIDTKKGGIDVRIVQDIQKRVYYVRRQNGR